MNAAEKRRFIRDLVRNVKNDILAKVPMLPDHWDGHELRRYIADKFDESAMTVGRRGPYGKPYAHRTSEYRNAVTVGNL